MYDIRLLEKYDSVKGLSFCFDGLHNLQVEQHIVAMISFNPPGNYYKTPRATEDIFLCGNVDVDSPISAPKYSSDFVMLKHVDPTEHKQVLIDLYSVSGEKLANIGWTILPMFYKAAGSIYANSGLYQVILMKY